MADYYPVLARAVAGLDPTSSESRREIYERARKALVQQLRSLDPPLSESEITRERLSLEDAVRRVEAEVRPRHAVAPTPAMATVTAPAPARAEPPVGPPPAPAATPEPGLMPPVGPPVAPAAPAARIEAPPAPPPPPPEPAPPRSEPPPLFGARELRRSRWPAIAAGIVVLVVAAIGGGAYLARDQLTDMLSATPAPAKGVATIPVAPPKTAERVGTEGASAAAPAAAVPAAPAAPAQPTSTPAPAPNTTVARLDKPAIQNANPSAEAPAAASQRAILYEETPDRQSGSAFVGTATWSLDPGIAEGGHPRQTALIANVDIPGRKLHLKMTIKRNTDQTLPASHTIDLQFTLPSDFANGGIANVPGILFKPTEEAGGQALAALSVRVMDNFFLIGLSNNPAEQAKNLAALRDNSWVDLPILYDNGRRAVLTLGKGQAGTKDFEQAMAAWQEEAAVAANAPPPGSAQPPASQPSDK